MILYEAGTGHPVPMEIAPGDVLRVLKIDFDTVWVERVKAAAEKPPDLGVSVSDHAQAGERLG